MKMTITSHSGVVVGYLWRWFAVTLASYTFQYTFKCGKEM